MWSPVGPIWSVKYINFGQKLPIWTVHHTFQESRHPEFTKNSYYVLPPEGSQKKVSAKFQTKLKKFYVVLENPAIDLFTQSQHYFS